MVNDCGWLRRWVMSFTYRERRKKRLIQYKQRVEELRQMSAEELEFEYITIKSVYEQKKSILGCLLLRWFWQY